MKAPIYTITLMDGLPTLTKSPDKRCVGWFETQERAKDALSDNWFDLWEGDWDYAVIETVHEGLYQTDTDYELYSYDTEKDRYVRMDVPEEMRQLCSFGIG